MNFQLFNQINISFILIDNTNFNFNNNYSDNNNYDSDDDYSDDNNYSDSTISSQSTIEDLDFLDKNIIQQEENQENFQVNKNNNKNKKNNNNKGKEKEKENLEESLPLLPKFSPLKHNYSLHLQKIT